MALTCIFCGAQIDGCSRCPGCGGPIEAADPFLDFAVDDSGAQAHEVVDVHVATARAELDLAAAIPAADPLPAAKARNARLFSDIKKLRADIRGCLGIIETLAAKGVRKQIIPACQNDDEVRMDRAFLSLRVYNQRHAAAMIELAQAPTDADAASTDLPALCRDIYEALRGNGYVPYDDLAARFGVSLPRVVLAVKQLEIAGERTGARVIRYTHGAEIDELVQPDAAAVRVPIRAASAIAAIPVRQVPGQRAFFGVHRGSKLKQGRASLAEVTARLALAGAQVGRAG